MVATRKPEATWNVNVGPFLSRAVLAMAIAMCFVWSQVAGWSVTGTMLADGGARRTVASTASDVQANSLQGLRDERAAIGVPRPRGTVEAELDLELRRTSKQYPNGDGPKATKLRGELKAIERAAELDQLIKTQLKSYQDTPAVAGGDVDVTIPVGFAQRWGWVPADTKAADVAKDVQFYFIVFFVFATGFFATFGFRLVGVQHTDISLDLLRVQPIVWLPLIFLIVEAGMNALFGYRRAGGGVINFSGYLQALMFAGVAVLGAYLPTRWDAAGTPQQRTPAQKFLDDWDWGPERLAPPGQAHVVAGDDDETTQPVRHTPGTDRRPRNPLGGRVSPQVPFPDDVWPTAPGVRAPHQGDVHAAPQQHLNGAPITINFSPASQGHGGASEMPQLPPPPSRGRMTEEAASHQSHDHQTVLPPLQTGAPVDRSAVRSRQDQLLLFKHACLMPAPGAMLSGDDMYARYAAWAGRRCMSRPAFLTVFGELAGVAEQVIAGEQYFTDVDVRTTAALEVMTG